MLKLKRVELQGFKSFCDRTELRFNGGGIAAVVGPNGCGKSNLSDAISWVLGEQSAKSLRGARMEDVIFVGTKDRKPLGMASVTMTLVDPAVYQEIHDAGRLAGMNGHSKDGLKPGEITITRRLFRSSESEYLINGRIARLRDIQDLFMGTGLGPESYAIIEQGRIGQILSSKPQDRRSIIEEAAGITKYKTRRKLAEAKLESAKQNLARVFDILEEVTRQVNSLKRQAAKARRFTELKAELDGRLRILLKSRYLYLEREAAKAALDLSAASTELRNLADRVARNEQEQQRLQTACYQTEARLTETRKQLAELNVEAERTRGKLEYQARQIGAIEQRIGQGEEELAQSAARLAQLESELEAHRGQVEELEGRISSARRRAVEKNEAREVLQARLRQREEAIESGRRQVLRLLGEASTLKNQLAQVDEFLVGLERESARVNKEEQAAAADLERLAAIREQLSEATARRQMELETVTGERRRVEEELALSKGQAAEGRRAIDQLRAETSQLKARRDSLEEILSHRAYTTESVKKLFGAIEQGQTGEFRPMGVLADFVEVDPAYEKAAEEFLHEELEYVVVPSWQQAESGIDLMRSDLDGRATFMVHPEQAAGAAEPVLGPETGIVGRLSDCLRLTNGLKDCARDLLPRLAACFIAEDRTAAQSLAVQYPHFYFLLKDGICYHGYAVSGGKKTGSGPLALKRELRELSAGLKTKQRQLDEEVARLASLDRQIAALEASLERLRAAQQSQEKEALALEHEVRKAAEETARANSRLSVARVDLERLRQEAERSIAQRERNAAAVEEKDRLRLEQEQKLEAERQDLDDLEAETARAAEEHAALRVELAGLEERQRSVRGAMSRVENNFRERTARREQLASEIQQLGVERARLLSDNIELDSKATLLAGRLIETEDRVNRMAEDELQLRATLAEGEEDLKRLRALLEEAREKRSQVEVELVKRQAELKFLDETSQKELNCPVAELAAGEETVLDAGGLAEVERQYQEIKTRIDNLGPVNPQALEEYQETQQRYDFLNTQRQDLLDSIRDTEKAIQDIDQVSRQKFNEAFEAVNANFREAFRTLFGGGVGEMRLTDESNAAESGIDVVASPPGKRLQNVLLLSGGEKALTALALLMAIFRYQPSPFCILDEVDAPLDEANIDRLMRLLKEMSRTTQFIIITHSKKTMEAAQTLYGVTMQEPGVSKLVSVRFQMPAPDQRSEAVA
ncbi:MAG: chromosome segregation protein SMC [Bryobacterales bacterium]|nr:chromosome segregation protein SMC [Bryobacterales bacterium]